jgi:hypothetical protein
MRAVGIHQSFKSGGQRVSAPAMARPPLKYHIGVSRAEVQGRVRAQKGAAQFEAASITAQSIAECASVRACKGRGPVESQENVAKQIEINPRAPEGMTSGAGTKPSCYGRYLRRKNPTLPTPLAY